MALLLDCDEDAINALPNPWFTVHLEAVSGPPDQGAQEVIDFLGDLLARDLVQG